MIAVPGKQRTYVVGDVVDLHGKAALIRHEDGTVVTARSTVRFSRPGKHVVIVDGVETAYEVA